MCPWTSADDRIHRQHGLHDVSFSDGRAVDHGVVRGCDVADGFDSDKTLAVAGDGPGKEAPVVLEENPDLAGVSIVVPSNALFSNDGTRGGRVGIAPVPPDRLPGPLPVGVDFPLVITVQTEFLALMGMSKLVDVVNLIRRRLNPQLKITMSGGALAERFANRRTDYAMVTDDPADFANSQSYGQYLERMGTLFGELARVLRPKGYAVVIVRDAYQDGAYRFVASDLATRASAHGFVPKGDLIWYQAGTRLPSISPDTMK